ncbi:hypothetical protein VTN96DRAFT_285 [Rasamsonia emersonii]|uniref:Uncharacterized protein n=1 Tax=Rasamsonia emersonii (strain ATCC 16479 / CBS 393.64 / IMI 116815) TaxID=1408163 RepID=A0A0F4YWU3_RASE3|nr:hypothetical protein T310_3641 [Rasamsonia emersonii CBS 393.64]KKA22311.1 hypothetical protein T310_3641 [Rasamsonia emersonii CBS 393.64]
MSHPFYSVDFDLLMNKKPGKGASAVSSQRPSPLAMDPENDGSSWRDDTESLSDYSDKAPLLFPSRSGEPGLADERLLSRGLQVPSKSSLLTSGFEYPAVLANYHVSEDDWARFTREITEGAKLSARQWSTVIGSGLGTLVIGGMMVGFFSPVPAVMVAAKTRQSKEMKNLAAAVAMGSESTLPRRIKEWNESFFKPRGVMIRVDLPYQTESLEEMDVCPTSPSLFSLSGRISSWKNDEDSIKKKASRRGRIVIIPLEGRSPSQLSRSSTLVDEPSQ